MTAEANRLPGLSDLMFDNLNHPDPALAEQAAQNVFVPISLGIEAIGELLYSAATNEQVPPSMEAIANIGCLLQELGGLTNRLENYNGAAKLRKDLAEALAAERADSKAN